MGSTRSGEPCGPARLAALVLLLVAVLVGSFAPACAQAQNLTTVTLTLTNDLVNNITVTITASELPGSENKTFSVQSGRSETVPIDATDSAAPDYVVKVLGYQGPLGGKTFSTRSTPIARGAAVTSFEVVFVGPCEYDKSGKVGLKGETYVIRLTQLLGQLGVNVEKTKVSSECVQPQPQKD